MSGLLDIGEMWTIGGLVVPRPLTIVAGREDRLFPIDSTRRAYEELVDLYEVVDGDDRCSLLHW
ncbi:D-(-)-3-hydroxybutyrate oligomer hydrolase [Halocatena marina]|uniref:D-(-)-3-hydroxybutyrate oligomer hydrolase n=1 Tax=Halocatena marina TaxID=2934937 RepID=A0ABD5YVH5_9EURY|nr:D-(-)-3-hydroxybutyrate oligomer hydrolase [Halocatena marina]